MEPFAAGGEGGTVPGGRLRSRRRRSLSPVRSVRRGAAPAPPPSPVWGRGVTLSSTTKIRGRAAPAAVFVFCQGASAWAGLGDGGLPGVVAVRGCLGPGLLFRFLRSVRLCFSGRVVAPRRTPQYNRGVCGWRAGGLAPLGRAPPGSQNQGGRLLGGHDSFPTGCGSARRASFCLRGQPRERLGGASKNPPCENSDFDLTRILERVICCSLRRRPGYSPPAACALGKTYWAWKECRDGACVG